MTMTAYAWVAFGGALGAMARAFVGTWVQSKVHSTFPWGTFLINASGSLLLGFVATLLTERIVTHPNIRPFIAIGFIGAYTTFSTFEYESFQLGPSMLALGNVLGSVTIGYCCIWVGARLAMLLTTLHAFGRS